MSKVCVVIFITVFEWQWRLALGDSCSSIKIVEHPGHTVRDYFACLSHREQAILQSENVSGHAGMAKQRTDLILPCVGGLHYNPDTMQHFKTVISWEHRSAASKMRSSIADTKDATATTKGSYAELFAEAGESTAQIFVDNLVTYLAFVFALLTQNRWAILVLALLLSFPGSEAYRVQVPPGFNGALGKCEIAAKHSITDEHLPNTGRREICARACLEFDTCGSVHIVQAFNDPDNAECIYSRIICASVNDFSKEKSDKNFHIVFSKNKTSWVASANKEIVLDLHKRTYYRETVYFFKGRLPGTEDYEDRPISIAANLECYAACFASHTCRSFRTVWRANQTLCFKSRFTLSFQRGKLASGTDEDLSLTYIIVDRLKGSLPYVSGDFVSVGGPAKEPDESSTSAGDTFGFWLIATITTVLVTIVFTLKLL